MTQYPYQNASLSADARVDDLLPRLSLEEKVGLMYHMMIGPGPLDEPLTAFGLPATRTHLNNHLNHFNLMASFTKANEFVDFANKLQRAAAETRWGIPITLSTDPRHAFSDNPQLGPGAACFSQWPERIGIAALADVERTREYADIIRKEYLAAGFRAALHPQADLVTEYRWSRIAGCYGESADLASALVVAEIEGLHGKSFGSESVSTTVKHFTGGGPTRDGLDAHFSWGQEQDYPGGEEMFAYHLKPFRAAFAAGARFVMPSYGVPLGLKYEEVGVGFNKGLLTDLLRKEMGFKGAVVSDWAIIEDMNDKEKIGDLATARAWGVEHLSYEDRLIKAIDAGNDQLGGEYDVALLLKVVRDGRIPEARIDESARRLLLEKFELGLFEHRYLDQATSEKVIGCEKHIAAGLAAQKDCTTLLKNDFVKDAPILPLAANAKLYLEGFKTKPSSAQIVDTPEEADVAVVRLATPWEKKGKGQFAQAFHHGSLDFAPEILENVAKLSNVVPVVVQIHADRPPVLDSLNESASAILLTYGINTNALMEVLQGHSPKGKLPFDLPRSTAAVVASKVDTPFDTVDPVYRFGHGLRYAADPVSKGRL